MRRLLLTRAVRAVLSCGTRTLSGLLHRAGRRGLPDYVCAFGNKRRLTQEIIWTTFEVAGVNSVIAEGSSSRDPEDWLRGVARASRLVGERLAGPLRFLQESGDPALLAEHGKVQTRRRDQESERASRLTVSGRLRAGLDHDRMWDILWVFSGTHLDEQLVIQQGWTPDAYESWLADVLITQPSRPEQRATAPARGTDPAATTERGRQLQRAAVVGGEPIGANSALPSDVSG